MRIPVSGPAAQPPSPVVIRRPYTQFQPRFNAQRDKPVGKPIRPALWAGFVTAMAMLVNGAASLAQLPGQPNPPAVIPMQMPAKAPPAATPEPEAVMEETLERVKRFNKLVLKENGSLGDIRKAFQAMPPEDTAVRTQVYGNHPFREDYVKALKQVHAKATPADPDSKAVLDHVETALVQLMIQHYLGPDTGSVHYQAVVRAQGAKTLVELYGQDYPFLKPPANKFLDLHPISLKEILKEIPAPTRNQIGVTLVKEAEAAVSKNTPEMRTSVKRLERYFTMLPPDQMQVALKDQVQLMRSIIGTTLQRLESPKTKEEAEQTAEIYNMMVSTELTTGAPAGLFDPAWYPTVNKMLNQVETMKPGSSERLIRLEQIAKLAVLELRDNSGVAEPKIYAALMAQLEKNPTQQWKDYVPVMLDKIVIPEAVVNHNPPAQNRVLDKSQDAYMGGTYYRTIIPRESLIRPLEVLVNREMAGIYAKRTVLDSKEYYDQVYAAANKMLGLPFHRPEAILTWQAMELQGMAKAPQKDLPERLKQFQGSTRTWSMLQNSPGRVKLVTEGAKYLKPILETGCQLLKSPDAEKVQLGGDIIAGVANAYPWYDAAPFAKDPDLARIFEPVLKDYRTIPCKDGLSVGVMNQVLENYVRLNSSSPALLNQVAELQNAQMAFAAKDADAAKTPEAKSLLASRQLHLTEGAAAFKMFVDLSNLAPSAKMDMLAPVLKNLSRDILAKTSDIQVLTTALDFEMKTKGFPGPKDADPKQIADFHRDVIIGDLLATTLKAADRVEPRWQSMVRRIALSNLPDYIYFTNDPSVVKKAVDVIAQDGFDKQSDKGLAVLEDFNGMLKSKLNSWWDSSLMVPLLDAKREQWQGLLNATATQLAKGNDDAQAAALDDMMAYDAMLHHLASRLASNTTLDNAVKERLQTFQQAQNKQIADLVLDKLKTAQVIENRLPGGIDIRNRVFEKLNDSLGQIVTREPKLVPKAFEIITDRIKTEPNANTRAMLIQSTTRLPLDIPGLEGQPMLKLYNDRLTLETSPVVCESVGKAYAKRVLDELLDGKDKARLLSDPIPMNSRGAPLPDQFNELIDLQDSLKAFGQRVFKYDRTNEFEIDPKKEPVQAAFFNMMAQSRGRNLEPLIRQHLKENKGIDKHWKEVDKMLLRQTVRQVLGNMNYAVGGTIKGLNDEAAAVQYGGEDNHQVPLKMRDLTRMRLQVAGGQLTDMLERHFYSFHYDILPQLTDVLVDSYMANAYPGSLNAQDGKMKLMKHRLTEKQDKKELAQHTERLLQYQFLADVLITEHNLYAQDFRDNGGQYKGDNAYSGNLKIADDLLGKLRNGTKLTDADVAALTKLDPEGYKERVTIPAKSFEDTLGSWPVFDLYQENLKISFIQYYIHADTREGKKLRDVMDLVINKRNGFKFTEDEQRQYDRMDYTAKENLNKLLDIQNALQRGNALTYDQESWLRDLDSSLYSKVARKPLENIAKDVITTLLDRSMRRSQHGGLRDGFDMVEGQLGLSNRMYHLDYTTLKEGYLLKDRK